jgi:osmoprotectant transport system permease protein
VREGDPLIDFDWIVRNLDQIWHRVEQHLVLTAIAVGVGLLISFVLALVVYYRRGLYPPLAGVTAVVYTIPSIALFVLLPQLLGTKILDPLNVVVALTVYSVALLVRVIADGLASVPHDTVQAATAMGYRPWQRLWHVELPVAVPAIGGGLRVAVVSNVSIVTMAALLGIPQLGSLFTQGFSLRLTVPIVAGIVMCLVLSVVLDVLVHTATRALTPWQQKAETA